MPDYSYQAQNASGARANGSLSAATKTAAMDNLTNQGLFVTRINEMKSAGGVGAARKIGAESSGGGFSLGILPPVSTSEMVMMIRRLATLVSAGIPLVECLKAISRQVSTDILRHTLEQVTEDVQHGIALSNALGKHPRIFPEMLVSMVHVGETGGILDEVLEQMADFAERDKEARSEVVAAMIYPLVVMFVAIATVIFLMVTVIPKLTEMFVGMEDSLPLPTVLLLGITGFLNTYGFYCLGAVVVLGVSLIKWKQTELGARIVDKIKLHTPVLGSLSRRSSIARFSRSLGALLSGGVPLMEGLDVVKRVMDSQTMTDAVERIKEHVRKGRGMARGMGEEDMFPDMVQYMVSAGEESGHLDAMLFKIADVYDMETRNAIKIMISMLTPIMILVMACIVGFIAMAILLPIFQMNQMVG